jgi:hypothetical protein
MPFLAAMPMTVRKPTMDPSDSMPFLRDAHEGGEDAAHRGNRQGEDHQRRQPPASEGHLQEQVDHGQRRNGE